MRRISIGSGSGAAGDGGPAGVHPVEHGRDVDVEGRSRRRGAEEPVPGAGEVLLDARRIAANGVDERGRELDQAGVQGPLAGVPAAHPGGLQELVGEEEVAASVGVEGLAPARPAARRSGSGR